MSTKAVAAKKTEQKNDVVGLIIGLVVVLALAFVARYLKGLVYGVSDIGLGIPGKVLEYPLWAALVAILAENLGSPLGFLNPTLYGELAGAGFNDITSGNNAYHYGDVTVAGYQAAAGWDCCTGYGSPDGTALLNALQALSTPRPPAAG